MILITELTTTKYAAEIKGLELCPIITWCRSRRKGDRREIGTAPVNQIDSEDGKWFYGVFVKGYIAGFSGWKLG